MSPGGDDISQSLLNRGDSKHVWHPSGVHCCSGRDRSVFSVFALFRLRYHFLEADAWNLLQSRLGVDGWPCANWCGKEDGLAWVEQVLAI